MASDADWRRMRHFKGDALLCWSPGNSLCKSPTRVLVREWWEARNGDPGATDGFVIDMGPDRDHMRRSARAMRLRGFVVTLSHVRRYRVAR